MELKKDIIKLFNNKTSGSSAILNKLNRIIKKESGNHKYIRLLIKECRKQFSAFTIIQNYLDNIGKALNDPEALSKRIYYYENYNEMVFNKIFENGKDYFLNVSKVLTLSNSLTIFNFLTQLYRMNNKLEVIITESRPKNEGRVMAKELMKSLIPVEYISDYAAASFIISVDAVIIGADKILYNRNIVNKTGSRTLAILCKYFNKPFYVIGTKSKLSNESEYNAMESDPAEIWNYSGKKLKVRNYYFEEIESNLITRLITD